MTQKTRKEIINLGSTIYSGIKKSFSSSFNATGASNPISSVFKAVFKAPVVSLFYSLKKTLPEGISEIKKLVFNPSTTDILKKNNDLTDEINKINSTINLKMNEFKQKYNDLELKINSADRYKQADLKQSFNTYNALTAKQKEIFDKQKEIGNLKSKKDFDATDKQTLLNAENELIQRKNELYNANETFIETLRNLPNDDNKANLESLYESGNTIIKLTLQNQQNYSDINQTYKELRKKNQRDLQIIAELPTTDAGVAKILEDSGYSKKDTQVLLRFINGTTITISDNDTANLNKEILALKKNMLEDPSTTSRKKKVRLLEILEARAKVYMYDKMIPNGVKQQTEKFTTRTSTKKLVTLGTTGNQATAEKNRRDAAAVAAAVAGEVVAGPAIAAGQGPNAAGQENNLPATLRRRSSTAKRSASATFPPSLNNINI